MLTNSSISVSDADADIPHALTVDATEASSEQATFGLSKFGATISTDHPENTSDRQDSRRRY